MVLDVDDVFAGLCAWSLRRGCGISPCKGLRFIDVSGKGFVRSIVDEMDDDGESLESLQSHYRVIVGSHRRVVSMICSRVVIYSALRSEFSWVCGISWKCGVS